MISSKKKRKNPSQAQLFASCFGEVLNINIELINNNLYHKFMAPKDKQIKKKVVTHKPKIAHKLAKYVRAYPVHLRQGEGLPSISHLCNNSIST
jgi:hypothetical protein